MLLARADVAASTARAGTTRTRARRESRIAIRPRRSVCADRGRSVAMRAISDPPPAPKKESGRESGREQQGEDRTPSLEDYDSTEYPAADVHDQSPIPRLERAVNSAIIWSAVLVIDKLYEGRDYPRFYALETVARVPYFSFLSVLHLYETLGFWRRADYLKVHFAQTMNEFHHLLIMESMGGDERFTDRFFAQHMAVFYYFIAVGMYLVSPRMAYNLSEQVEEHAYHTYDEFLNANEAELKSTAPPPIATHYYTQGDLFLFDEFQTGNPYAGAVTPRRPSIDTLYDVFVNVRNDEAEHMKTMQFCQLPGTILRSPSEAAACAVSPGVEPSPGCVESYREHTDRTCEGLVECLFNPGVGVEEEEEKEKEAESEGASAR